MLSGAGKAGKDKKSRWSTEKRLEFIDFRLFWEGRINRVDLIEAFGVSVPQASADLTAYQEAAPKNAVYDKTLKAYVPGPRFQPRFFKPSADGYLAQLRFLEGDALDEGKAWANRLPSCSIVPSIQRRTESKTLREILDAIRGKCAISIVYQSMSHAGPSSRWISPHAIGYDGFRWHTRAWCYERNAFVDFVLARILDTDTTRPTDIDPATDKGWTTEFTLKIQPHSGLSEGQRHVVELDFGMSRGELEITMRLCLAYYFERQFNLDLDPKTTEPERQQIILANRAELVKARIEAGIDNGDW